MSRPSSPKIVIVGAGPAGIRAAATLVAAGLHPVVIDEGHRAGGQIYRRPPDGFVRTPEQLYGSEAVKAQELHALFDRLTEERQLTYQAHSSVIAVHQGRLHVLGEGGVQVISYDRLVLATGASDRIAPVPGWQNAGVYSLGAAQIALKAQGVALGRRVVLIGSGPLLTLVGAQLLKAGADVAAVLDTSSWRRQMRGFPGLAARPIVALRGLALRARLGGRYHAGVTLERIEANASGVIAMRWRDAGASPHVTWSAWAGTCGRRRIWPIWSDASLPMTSSGNNGCRRPTRWGGPATESTLQVTGLVSSARMGRRSRGVSRPWHASRISGMRHLPSKLTCASWRDSSVLPAAWLVPFPGRPRWCEQCPTTRSSAAAKISLPQPCARVQISAAARPTG